MAPPFSEGELADPTEWLRDPWRAFEEAKRVWGPSTLRAASAKREVTRAFEVIRQLVPRIQDPAIQDTVAGLIRDAITRRWNPRALAAAEQRQKWADFPSEIVELREEYDKEVKKTKPRFRSRGPESRVRQGGKGYRGSSAHRDAPFRGDSRKGGKKGGAPRPGRPLRRFGDVTRERITDALHRIYSASYAEATWRNMRYSASKWARFVAKAQLQSHPHADQLLAFIGWCHAEGLKPSSILTEVANVRATLRLEGVVLSDHRLTMALRGLAKLKTGEVRQARPISKETLYRTVDELTTVDPQAAVVLAVAWLTASRVGDVRRQRVGSMSCTAEGVLEVKWTDRKDWRNVGIVTQVWTGRLQPLIASYLFRRPTDESLGGVRTTAQYAALLPRGHTAHSIRRGAARHALTAADPESVRTLTLHATLMGLIRYAPNCHGEEFASLLHDDTAVKPSLSNAVLLWDLNARKSTTHVPAPPTARIAQSPPPLLDFLRADEIARSAGGHAWLEASRWIRDPGFFYANYDCFEGRRLLEPLSRLHPSHAADVATSTITGRVPRNAPIVEMRVFTVAKKTPDEGRLICWPKALNEHPTRDPSPATILPSREEVWETIRMSTMGIEVDAVSFFHAFPMHPSISRAFGMRLPVHGKRVLKVMPMGWDKSMGIATTLADLLAQAVKQRCPAGRVTPWVDNFFLSAPDSRTMRSTWEAWKEASSYIGLKTKDEKYTPRSRVTWLGLDVNLAENLVRAPPKVVGALGDTISEAERMCTYRGAYRILGSINFYMYFLGVDAWDFPTLSRFQSRFGRLLAEQPALWDTICLLWPSFLSALRAVTKRISRWQSVPKRAGGPTYLLYTDASLSGWGILASGFFAEGGSWSTSQSKEPIHRLEARALLKGVERISPLLPWGATIRAMVDNTVCVHSVARGRCRDFLTAEVLRAAKQTAGHRGQRLELRYVSTLEQLADPLSRGKPARL
ncbi:hypothetical protein DIPPA_31141 [Diplonema papillatum]|nr:hypothetical protein DIPPA_31141 [Diplonema papillatum]